MPRRRGAPATRTLDIPVWLAVVVLLTAGLYAYSNSLGGVLAYDDAEALAANPHVKTLWPLTEAAKAPKDTTLAGRPVASVTFALNYALAPAGTRDVWQAGDDRFAQNIWGYHAFNIAVHLSTALVLFGAIRRTLRSTAMKAAFGNSATAIALASSLMWVVHPLTTAAVTYLVQRVESLMSAFYLLTLYCAIRSWQTPNSTTWRWCSVVACALGMATKETMVSAPLIVAVWLWVFEGRDPFLNGRIRTLLVGLASTWVILAWLVSSGARTASIGQLGGWTATSYLLTQSEVLVHYLFLSIFPASLVFSYGWPPVASWMSVLPQLIALAAALIAGAYAVWRRHPLGFVAAAFFLILAPTSSVLPVVTEVAAEHRMYLPLAAIISAVTTLAYVGLRRIGRRRTAIAGAMLVLAAVVPLSAATRTRNLDYSSLERLMLDAVTKRPDNVRGQIGVGVELLKRGSPRDAETHFRKAVASPQLSSHPAAIRGTAHMYLGASLGAQSRHSEAVGELEAALQLDQGLTEAYAMLGETYYWLGREREAVQTLSRAVEVIPDVPPVLNRLAWLLATSSDATLRHGRRAVDLAQQSVAITGGGDAMTLDTLAAAFAEAGRFPEAVETQNLAIARASQGSNPAWTEELRSRLALYQQGIPYRIPRAR